VSQVIYQVPSCFVLAAAWRMRKEGVRTPALCYAVHVLTSMVPIMAALVRAAPTHRRRPRLAAPHARCCVSARSRDGMRARGV
jgi:hypothetical protein